MCLTVKWFHERDKRLGRLSYFEGATELQQFITACGFTWKDLVRAGLLQLKPMRSTAEILDHGPTARGARYLKAEEDYDILVLKKGMGVKVVDLVRAARRRKVKAS